MSSSDLRPIVVAARALSYRVSGRVLLEDVSFELKRGDCVALLGPNGAGKTSLFQLILGLRQATSGTLEVFGHSPSDDRSRLKVGYVPERPYLRMDQTLENELLFLGALSNLKVRPLKEKIHELAGIFHLSDALSQPLKTFSKGMLQKTLMIQASLHDPEFMILDEPMSGLDVQSHADLMKRILQWKESGKTILFSSHQEDDVAALTDKILILDEGRLC